MTSRAPAAHRLADPLVDPHGVLLPDHGSHLDGVLELAPGRDRLHLGLEGVEEVAVDPARREDPLGRDAHLAGVGEPGARDGLGHLVQVGVRHDDHRGVGPELHRHPLDPGDPADPLPDVPAPGEGDLPDPRVRAEQVAQLAARAGEALDPLGGQPRLEQDLGELEGRQRRVGGRLHDDGVAGGQRGPDLVADEIQREVERG